MEVVLSYFSGTGSQVQQVKRVSKFTCTVCNSKQSVTKVKRATYLTDHH